MRVHTGLFSVPGPAGFGRRMLSAVLLPFAFAVLSACGNGSADSSAVSAETQPGALSSAAQPAQTAAPKAAASAAGSKAAGGAPSAAASSDGGYVLPASSSDASAAKNAESAVSSGSVFRSVFGGGSDSAVSAAHDRSGGKISLAEYDSLTEGMSYAAVESAVGGDGKQVWTFGEKGSSLYTVRCRWEGTGVSGAYAECTFEDGKLTEKIQFGLN